MQLTIGVLIGAKPGMNKRRANMINIKDADVMAGKARAHQGIDNQ
jgi:hypothetical protein